ncbi:phage tail protein [Pseudoalteromonas luteoviolacea]|uniref:phage tail protein n=1 Tax=Pseudoalteromonas luteoviolacea TaxID=43657 RepID=UPI001150D920|nr:phage tail protein [Pseudoalteromonas luteoviolacea]TQF70490.1 hypothetical protein FLM44_05180 [Pseudoalteromonas luteoviolacea]
MSMSKLDKLKRFLIDANYKGHKLALPEQFDARIEEGVINPSSKQINGNGLLAARLYYSSIISIDPCYAPVELVSAYVSFWLQNNAEGDDSESAEFNCSINDDNSNEIEIVIGTFEEEIELVEVANGPFELGGKSYDFGEQSLWIAEKFTLAGEVDRA